MRILWSAEGELLFISDKARRYLRVGDNTEKPRINIRRPFKGVFDCDSIPKFFPNLTRMQIDIDTDPKSTSFLRGEIIENDTEFEDWRWIFVGLPPIRSASEMEKAGISLSEMPLHSGVSDFFVADEIRLVAIREAEKKNHGLNRANEKLRVTTEDLEKKTVILEKANEKLKALALRLEEALNSAESAAAAVLERNRMAALHDMSLGIYHDINNQLTPILSYAALMKDDAELSPSSRGQYCGTIMTAARDAAGLIERLRNQYRGSQSKVVENAYFDVCRVVEEAIELAKPETSEYNNVEINRTLEEGVICFGIEAEIRQAVQNLVLNAIQAVGLTGGTVSVQVISEGEEIHICVVDDGIGMTDSEIEKCGRERFTTKGRNGNGLGVSIVIETAKAHGGDLKISSKKFEGSAFTLIIARDSDRDTAAIEGCAQPFRFSYWSDRLAPYASRVLGDGKGNPTLVSNAVFDLVAEVERELNRPLRIALVDDNMGLINVASIYADRLKISCDCFPDGEIAFSSMTRKAYDLAIVDLEMPRMGGEELVKKLRKVFSPTSLLVVTGKREPLSAELRKSADFVIAKPMPPRDMFFAGMVLVIERLREQNQM